jgi:hypothetical protein
MSQPIPRPNILPREIDSRDVIGFVQLKAYVRYGANARDRFGWADFDSEAHETVRARIFITEQSGRQHEST